MKYSVTSENTKKMFSESLTKLLKKKSLTKITVKEIVEDCGVNRKTFYYHFLDIYDLVRWTLDRETFSVAENMNSLDGYGEVIKYILGYVKQNNYILNCLYDSVGKEQFSVFFYGECSKKIRSLLDGYISSENLRPDKNYVNFLCDFYTKALAEILVDWLKNKEELPEDTLVSYITSTIKISAAALLKNSEEIR